MADRAELVARLRADVTQFESAMKSAQKQSATALTSVERNVNSFGKQLDQLADKLRNVGAVMTKVFTIPLSIIGGAGVVRVLKAGEPNPFETYKAKYRKTGTDSDTDVGSKESKDNANHEGQ